MILKCTTHSKIEKKNNVENSQTTSRTEQGHTRVPIQSFPFGPTVLTWAVLPCVSCYIFLNFCFYAFLYPTGRNQKKIFKTNLKTTEKSNFWYYFGNHWNFFFITKMSAILLKFNILSSSFLQTSLFDSTYWF